MFTNAIIDVLVSRHCVHTVSRWLSRRVRWIPLTIYFMLSRTVCLPYGRTSLCGGGHTSTYRKSVIFRDKGVEQLVTDSSTTDVYTNASDIRVCTIRRISAQNSQID